MFIALLVKALEDVKIDAKNRVIFMQDNAIIHLSKITKAFVTSKDLRLYCLPQYTPTLALVELVFGIIKRKIKSKRATAKINYSKPSGKKAIIESISKIGEDVIRK
jgi:transposase